MPIINNAFNGKLNLDVANYRISNGDYIDALNITKDAEGQGQDRVVSNILGNENIAYTLPAGTNKAIGFYADKIRNRAYYFIWNSNGYNTILYYNGDTNVITKVLTSKTDSDGIDILSFNPSYKVLSVNIFYRDDDGNESYKTIAEISNEIGMGDWGDFDDMVDEIREDLNKFVYKNCGFGIWWDDQKDMVNNV